MPGTYLVLVYFGWPRNKTTLQLVDFFRVYTKYIRVHTSTEDVPFEQLSPEKMIYRETRPSHRVQNVGVYNIAHQAPSPEKIFSGAKPRKLIYRGVIQAPKKKTLARLSPEKSLKGASVPK